MNANELLDTLKFGESITLECKKARNEVPKSVWETYSSFANTNGGNILLGIEENPYSNTLGGHFSIVGVENADKIIKDFWNTINSQKVNMNILHDEDVCSIEIDTKQVVCIHVPQADYRQKPIFINENILKGTFKRNYEGDFHCSEEEVKGMLRDANDAGNDGILIDGYGIEDIDTHTLQSYRREFELRNPDHVWNTLDDKDFLRNLGGYTLNRTNQKEGLTLAGLMMFGKGLAIRERFDNIRMDYIDKTGVIKGIRWSDRVTYDGRWENNLYNFFKIVIPKLTNNLKRPFRLEGMTRVDDTPVHKAVRESVTNLIIHSDYLITGILKIEKQENCFLLSNPGSLKLPVSMIYEGGNSKARNPHMQNMLRMIGYGENIGSGFPTILEAWKEENWRKPDLRENQELHQVDLKLWMVSLMPTESTEYLHNLLGPTYEKLTADEQIVLSTAYWENEVSNSRLQPLLNKNSLIIAKILCQLVDCDLLIKNTKGRWTTYELNKEYTKPEQSNDTKVTKSDEKVTKSNEKVTKSNEKVTKSDIIRNKILEFCDSPKYLSEIAEYIGYSHLSNLKKRHIDPLLGIYLKMTIPDKPQSRKQQYVTIKK